MMYYLVISITIFFQFTTSEKNKKNNLLLCVLLFILFLVAALRGNGIGDYFVYLNYSKLINTTSDLFNSNFPMEFGFRLLSYIVNTLKFNSQWVIASMNAISISCIYFFIKRHSPDMLFSVLLFLPLFFLFDMHTARTAVAIGIGSLSLKYVVDRKLIKFILIVFIAAQFHNIAWVLLIIYLINFIQLSYLFYIFSILISLFIVKLININLIISQVFKLVGLHEFESRFLIYSTNTTYGYEFSLIDPRLLLSMGILIMSLVIIENTYFKKNIDELTLKYLRLLIKVNWLLVILMIILSKNTIFVIRLYGLFSVFQIVQIPLFLKEYKNISNYNSYIILKYFLGLAYVLYAIVLIQSQPEYLFYFNK
ncbi:EpsG family protein [Vagococcus fluvialis]|uniref:EpsG family protein n=1 Tax=Vagococcus fluvialis TaxID=2738 RepID=UPI003794E59D